MSPWKAVIWALDLFFSFSEERDMDQDCSVYAQNWQEEKSGAHRGGRGQAHQQPNRRAVSLLFLFSKTDWPQRSLARPAGVPRGPPHLTTPTGNWA